MVATVPTTAPNVRNGSAAGLPHFMETVDGRYQCGAIVRASMGLTAFVYDRTLDPLDSASYTRQDLSANATVVAALGLLDPGNGISGIAVEDDHFMVASGVDDLGRLWLAGNGHADPQRVVFSDAIGGIPDLTTWNTLSWTAMPWAASGANAHTYNRFGRFNGQLIWLFDQQEAIANSQGRDILGYYLPTGRTKAQIQAGGTSGWRPIVNTATGAGTWTGRAGSSRGEIIYSDITPNSPSGPTGDPNDPGPANRAYINCVVVENRIGGDRLHLAFNFRTADTSALSSQCLGYAYTDSIGLDTLGEWRNIDGDLLEMPLHWDNRGLFQVPTAPRHQGAISLAIKADGRPVMTTQNGVSGVGVLSGYGSWIRTERIADAWVMTNLGTTIQGHPSPPQLVAVDPARRNYTVTTANGTCRMRTDGGNVGGPPGITNGADPIGGTWNVGGPIVSAGRVSAGTQTANYDEQFFAGLDPVSYQRTGRLDLLIPDGDQPRIYSLFNNRQIIAS